MVHTWLTFNTVKTVGRGVGALGAFVGVRVVGLTDGMATGLRVEGIEVEGRDVGEKVGLDVGLNDEMVIGARVGLSEMVGE